ncbi:MAG TPA: phosphoadenosine phosphosulfate reductase family protein [Tepidisphaeraceae bacterium]|nr:phosphoadenosine phosphosulfate reductase family protein [Tepidisphaeraceae bacterium]
MAKEVRHILSLSGGKDSTALAIYMRERVPNMEYVFCDTDKELPETYDYLAKLEAFLGKQIVRLRDHGGFDHWLKVYGGYLPSSRMRWCTRMLKIRPFEKYVGDDPVKMYIGIRGDENRGGYVTSKPNIEPVYPFRDDGITLPDVHRILEESGIGFPKYYEWRTRSGCYFCFYQRKNEWVGLMENHPELFEESKKYEKTNAETGERYTWSERESLEELCHPERVAEIKRRQIASLEGQKKTKPNRPLLEILGQDSDDDDDLPCSFCHT